MEEQKPKRGCFLSGILWVGTVFSAIGLIYNILARFVLKVSDTNNPMDPVKLTKDMSIGMFTYSIIITILALSAYILILCWKKQGCYLLAVISAIGFVMSFVKQQINMSTIAFAVIGFVVELLIIYFSYKAIEKREKFIREEA